MQTTHNLCSERYTTIKHYYRYTHQYLKFGKCDVLKAYGVAENYGIATSALKVPHLKTTLLTTLPTTPPKL